MNSLMIKEHKENINAGDGMIITHTGKWFNVLEPNSDDVDIEDIAHALSNQPRFTGHTREFYSVAQHSVLVAENCPSEYALIGLLHDASEAYLSDIARPVKKHPSLEPAYISIETDLTMAVFDKFGIPIAYTDLPQDVIDADNLLLRTEARDLMPATFPVYPGETLTEEIIPWSLRRAKREFIRKFEELYYGD